ncbi:two-component response regulator [Lentilactobacillus rapi DSM 19907 = JCM 15042]|uniref:HTH araC/xylS-type domain-containing protein n=2 Tax=Lentilactobacillus rapi TaxID=481723 RepID=A0A512PPT4_9LACO|nr:AraC family transcriptional regulator [Lentilactobacillus rapi]KRL16728.1 two-component response regulator [Lentilactobacillus rapi DSM 19907 = JCM 15042]GEP73218.1 hypothetical protein LRA02_20860 [Lentilactobacillus rapi]
MQVAVASTLNFLVRMLHTPIRIFDQDGFVQYWGHKPYEDVLINNQPLLHQLLKSNVNASPKLSYFNSHQIIAVVFNQKARYLIGPFKLSTTVEQSNSINKDLNDFCEFICLLQNIISDTDLIASDVIEQNGLYEKIAKKIDDSLTQNLFNNQEQEFIHNPYDQEVRELTSISEGDLKALDDSLHEVYDGRFPTLGPTKLRSLKNLAIVDLALIARAAIKGGLDYEKSFSINDEYIRSVETSEDEPSIVTVVLRAKKEYTQLIHDNKLKKDNKPTNLIVRRCKIFIQTHLHSKICLSQLSDYCQVSKPYLSRLFHNTQRVTLNDYIQQEKITASKRDLIYTDHDISIVATDYGYSSSSHYSLVFKRITQMTPTAFREQYGKV